MAEFDTYRTCHSCGFNGYMEPWFKKSAYPRLIAFIILLLGLIPGILFRAYGHNITFTLLLLGLAPGILFIALKRHKLVCPNCGKVRN